MVGLDWCQTYPIPNLKIKSFEKEKKKKIIFYFFEKCPKNTWQVWIGPKLNL
jgi:hypothetical protein